MNGNETPITKSTDPRLSGIPLDFEGYGYMTIKEANTYGEWSQYDKIYKKWMDMHNWNPPKQAQNIPQASYIPKHQKTQAPQGNFNEIIKNQKVDPDIKAMGLQLIDEIPEVKVAESLQAKKNREKLERHPLFDPEIHATKISELYPDLVNTRDEAMGSLIKLRRQFEDLDPKFARLFNNSNKMFNSYIKDIYKHLKDVVSDYDTLRVEIIKAESQLNMTNIKKQQKEYDMWEWEKKGFWESLGDVFSLMGQGLDPLEIEMDQHEKNLRKKIQLTQTVRMKEKEAEMKLLFDELNDTGLIDILELATENGTAYLHNIGEYEKKKKNLYANMVKFAANRDKGKQKLIQEGILDYQEFLLKDLTYVHSRESESKLLEKALEHTVGIKGKRGEMSYEEWDKFREDFTKTVQEKTTENRKKSQQLLDDHRLHFWERAQKYGFRELWDYIWSNEQYPGNLKRRFGEGVENYKQKIKGIYEPGIKDKVGAAIQELGSALMDMIPEVLAAVPGMKSVSLGITKTAQIAQAVINSAAVRVIGEWSKWGGGIALNLLWKHKMMIIQILMGADILTVTGTMGLMMLFKMGDMWLLKLLNRGLQYIPSYDPVYLNSTIQFAGADQTERWKMLQKGISDLEAKSKGATHAVFSGMKKYLPLSFRIKETSETTNLIKSKAYRQQRFNDLSILQNIANMNDEQLERYNPGNIPQPAEGAYTAQDLEDTTKISTVSDNILYHLIRHNHASFKSPMDAWRSSYKDKKLSDIVFDIDVPRSSVNTSYETGYNQMNKIMGDANTSAAIETKAILQDLYNVEGTPKVDDIKKLLTTYTADYKKTFREQLALESIIDEAQRSGDEKTSSKAEQSLLPVIKRKYKILYKMNFFKELGKISKDNHDTISTLSQLATVFATEHRDINRLITPTAPNAKASLDTLMASNTTDAWGFKEVLEKLHSSQIEKGGVGNYDYSQIAAMIAQNMEGMDREQGKMNYSVFNIARQAAAVSQGGYLDDLENTRANGIVSATTNFTANMLRTALNAVFYASGGGAAVPVLNFAFHVIPAVATAGLWASAVSIPFINEGVRSMLFSHLFSNSVLVPLVEWFSGETYSEMADNSEKYGKASYDLDIKAADALMTHRRRFELDQKKKLASALEKKTKYKNLLERSSRTYKATRERYEKSAPSDRVKKMQAAENRMIAEEVQYSLLLEETEKEIENIKKEIYSEPVRDDLIPGYSSLMKDYKKEVSSRSIPLKLVEHISSIPTYMQWISIAVSVSNILSDPWKYGKYKDSTGKERWRFPAPIAQLEKAYERMDEILEVDQTSDSALYEVYEGVNGVKVPPSAYEFEYGKGQHNIQNLEDALGVLGETHEAGVDFINDNFVLVDTRSFKLYENPASLIDYHMQIIKNSMGAGETKLDLSKEFNLIPDTTYTRSLFGGDSYLAAGRSLFDDNVGWDSGIDDITVRLVPKAVFEGVPGFGIKIPDQMSTLYETLLGPYTDRKYGYIYEGILDRLDKSELQFLIKRRTYEASYHPDTKLNEVFPEVSQSGYLVQGGNIMNTSLKNNIKDPSWILGRLYDRLQEDGNQKNAARLNSFALTGIKEGAPYSAEESSRMSVFDMQKFSRVLSGIYGSQSFSDPENMKTMSAYLGQRTVYDLISQINRKTALDRASTLQYAHAWSGFFWTWFYTGIQYRSSAFLDVFYNVAPMSFWSFLGMASNDKLKTDIDSLEEVITNLSKASGIATGVAMSAEKAAINAHRPQSRESTGTLETQKESINAAYHLLKDEKGVIKFKFGHMTEPLGEEVDNNTPIEWYIDKLIQASKLKVEENSKKLKEWNDFVFMKTATALGHDLLVKMITTAQIYFDTYAKVANAVSPFEILYEWKTGIPGKYREDVFSKINRGVMGFMYFGTDILMHYTSSIFSGTMGEVENKMYKNGPLDVLLENLPTHLPGEKTEIPSASGYEAYDLSRILTETPTDKIFRFTKSSLEYTFGLFSGLLTLNPDNPIIDKSFAAMSFGWSAATKTVSYMTGVGDAVMWLAKMGNAQSVGQNQDIKDVEQQGFVSSTVNAMKNTIEGGANMVGFSNQQLQHTYSFLNTLNNPMSVLDLDRQTYTDNMLNAHKTQNEIQTIDAMLDSHDPVIQRLAGRLLGNDIEILPSEQNRRANQRKKF